MKQAELGLNLTTKRTRKREFLDEMNRVVPWVVLVDSIGAQVPEGKKALPPFPVETMLHIHLMQQRFTLSDPTMEVSLHDAPLFRGSGGLDSSNTRLLDGSTILRFRHLPETHKLAPQILATVNEPLRGKGLLPKAGTVVDAALVSAQTSTTRTTCERDPDMHHSKKGNPWTFGMKAHLRVDAEAGLR